MPGVSIEDYTSAILKLVHRLRLDKEIDQVALYIDGLDPTIQGDVYRMKPMTIDQAEKDARLASSTMNRKTSDLSPKELAAEIVGAMNRNAVLKAPVAISDQYIRDPQDTSVTPTTAHAAEVSPVQYQTQQAPYQTQQPYFQPRQYRSQQNQQYRPQYSNQSRPQQQRSYGQQFSQQNPRNNWTQNNRPGFHQQNRQGTNQFGRPQNSNSYQNSYQTYRNRDSWSDSRQNSYENPYCRSCNSEHKYGEHVRPLYKGPQTFQRARTPIPNATRPQSAGN